MKLARIVRRWSGVVLCAAGFAAAYGIEQPQAWSQSATGTTAKDRTKTIGAGTFAAPTNGSTVTPSAPVRPTGTTANGGSTAGSTTKSGSFNGAAPTGVGKTTSSSGTSGVGAGNTLPGGRPAGPGVAAPNSAVAPLAPSWVPLPADHEKYLDEVLRYWQDSSSRIERYRCAFRRWEYDGANVPRDQKTGNLPPRTESSGLIRYATPDKGMFKVERTLHYTAPAKEGERPRYLPHKDEITEHWVCDGKSIFSFDNQKKQLIQTILPPEMQGKAIVNGPLPFMFGAEVDKVKQRFWMRVITPKDSTGEYWLEAVPKTRQDAANFKMVHVIIDEKDFLPKAMSIFNLNHDPKRNPSCITFSFDKRETNWNETLESLNVFHRDFWEPSTPFGYKKVVETLVPEGPVDRPGAAPTLPRQAELPKKTK